MREILTSAIEFLVPALEAIGALIITVQGFWTAIQYFYRFFGRETLEVTPLRLRLGQSLVMGLEFLVAADILRTSVSPSWDEILQLGALVGLRTLLNYFLERELQAMDEEISDHAVENEEEG